MKVWRTIGIVLAGVAWGETPQVFWTSYPVGAGDHVLVQGGDWGQSPVVEANGRCVAAQVLSDSGLVFPFPVHREEIVEGRIRSTGGVSRPFALNVPTVWWMQGDAGDTSTPGGTLRLFGRALAPSVQEASGKPRVRLGNRELALSRTDVWSLDAQIPADVPAGTYAVQVRNGLPGGCDWYEAGTWTVAAPRKIWKDDRFDVTDYGAESNDNESDQAAFQAAMAAAAAHGGGTVFVPYGRYILTETLVIPPGVLLKGEGRDVSQICWPDTMTPPENLIEGSHSFGLHDLFISSGQYRNGIVAKSGMSAQNCMSSARGTSTHDISLKRLYVKFVSDQWRDERNLDNFLPRYSMRGDGIILRNCLRAEIEDCEIHCDKDAERTLFFNFTGDFIRMANCRISGSGWAIFGGDRCIYENNTAFNCTYSISSVCRRMFWSHNTQRDLFTNNREAVTHDGAKTAWHVKKRGHSGCATGTVAGTHVQLVLPPDIRLKSGTNFMEWVGCELQITDGRGVGQTRTIASMKSYTDLEIDRPFDLAPDATSLFVIVAERRHLLYVDNDIRDAGVAIQLYGGVTDCVVARNRCWRAGGFHGSGRDYYGVITCWNVQFLDNVVEEGNCHRGAIGTDFNGVGSSLIGAFPPNVKWPFSQAYVYRNNEIKSNGSLFISVKNALVEKNVVRRSSVGVTSRRDQATMFICSNAFDRVDVPYLNLNGATILPHYVDPSREVYLSRLRSGTFKALRRRDVRRAFELSLVPHPWDIGFRAAVAGRTHKPLLLPVTLSIPGILGADVVGASVTIPSAGGWDFGGTTALAKKDGVFAGSLSITPPKTGGGCMFTWPVVVHLVGEGWTFDLPIEVNPLNQNRFLSWTCGLAKPGQSGKNWKPLAYNQAMDGHESTFPARIYGVAERVGADFHLRTSIEVKKATRFAFRRADVTTMLLVDGKPQLKSGLPVTTTSTVLLEPGRHVLELIQPAVETAGQLSDKGLALTCTFPDGCSAGDWIQL